jgi:hypothetical protein
MVAGSKVRPSPEIEAQRASPAMKILKFEQPSIRYPTTKQELAMMRKQTDVNQPETYIT